MSLSERSLGAQYRVQGPVRRETSWKHRGRLVCSLLMSCSPPRTPSALRPAPHRTRGVSSSSMARVLMDKPPARPSAFAPPLVFVAGLLLGVSLSVGVFLGLSRNTNGGNRSRADPTTHVDFGFSVRGIQTPRQENKTLNVYVRFRYEPWTDRCPYSKTDNTCIQYQVPHPPPNCCATQRPLLLSLATLTLALDRIAPIGSCGCAR